MNFGHPAILPLTFIFLHARANFEFLKTECTVHLPCTSILASGAEPYATTTRGGNAGVMFCFPPRPCSPTPAPSRAIYHGVYLRCVCVYMTICVCVWCVCLVCVCVCLYDYMCVWCVCGLCVCVYMTICVCGVCGVCGLCVCVYMTICVCGVCDVCVCTCMLLHNVFSPYLIFCCSV